MSQLLNGSASLVRRVALALVISSALGSIGWLWLTCTRNPQVDFLPRLSPAEWIVYPSGPKGTINARVELATQFRRSFTLEHVPSSAVLSIASLRQYSFSINGKPAGMPVCRGRTWKQPDQFEVAQALRVGENEITATVSNTNGPPVLWVSLNAGGLRLNSDEAWQASYAGATWRQARLATKPKLALAGSPVIGGEEPWAGARDRWAILLIFAAVSGAAYWLAQRRPLWGKNSPRSELLLLLGLSVLWLALFVNNLGVLPNLVGYDVDAHLAYIRFIQQHHALPRADQGWETFQPPLYYLLGAAWLGLLSLSASSDGGVMALRVLGLVIGIAHLVVVWACLRLLFPTEASKARWGLVLAAALPPMLYLSQYVTNEGLAAALVSACVFLTLRMLKQECISWKACAGLGLCLGAALLTKPTAVLAVPAVFGALLWKAWATRVTSDEPIYDLRFTIYERKWYTLFYLVTVLAACLVVCGWHYWPLWAQYGSPFIGVWDPRLGYSWWQDDGYRTREFYLRFGSVLVHPWFSAFRSFGDGIYATLWGDGLFGGVTNLVARPPWNYELMAAGYLLALVPTLGVLAGGILALARFIRQPSAEWLLLLGLAFLVLFAMVHLSIVLPYACHVKAFYGLCALVPFCAFGAWGFEALCRWAGKLRPVMCILLGFWAMTSYAAFWVSPSAPATVRSCAQSLWNEHREKEAAELLAGLALRPNPSLEAEAALAYLVMDSGDLPKAAEMAQAAVQRGPDDPSSHMALAMVLAHQERLGDAIAQARRAVQLAPGNDSGYHELAFLLLKDRQADEAARLAREGLGVAPFNAELRDDLGSALAAQGQTAEALSQMQLACDIKPHLAQPRLLLGAALARQGQLAEAITQLREAVRLEPKDAEAHAQLGSVLAAQHQTAEAIAQFDEALRLQPDLAAALNNLAWIRASSPQKEFRNGPEAVRLAERACQVTKHREAVMVGTLAAAYAEAGRFDEAIATARKARELALAGGNHELADKNQRLIELFSAHRPYREDH